MKRLSLRTLTTAIVALILPATLFIGVATAAFYKSTNPDNVDITQGLAYLQQTMIAVILTFVVLLIASIAGIVTMYRRERSFVNAKLPLTLLGIVVVLCVGTLVLNAYSSSVQDQYLIDHGRPTLQQYFDQLDKKS